MQAVSSVTWQLTKQADSLLTFKHLFAKHEFMNTNTLYTPKPRFLTIVATLLKPLSKLLVLAVLGLIFFGALVTSNNAGLAVPDWPTTYGENMFLYHPSKWVGGIFYEHFHRLLASGIGFLTLVLAVAIFLSEQRAWLRALGGVALITVVVQGVLGGLTVLYKLPDVISVAHGMLAQTFFCLTIVIAYALSDEFAAKASFDVSNKNFKRALVIFGVIYMQLFFGAVMRHAEAGLALTDFPKMGGSWWPSASQTVIEATNQARRALGLSAVNYFQVFIHLLHRVWAVVVLLLGMSLLWKIFHSTYAKKVKFICSTIGIGLVIQTTLGVLTVLSVRHPHITSLHVVFGALMLGLACLLCLRNS